MINSEKYVDIKKKYPRNVLNIPIKYNLSMINRVKKLLPDVDIEHVDEYIRDKDKRPFGMYEFYSKERLSGKIEVHDGIITKIFYVDTILFKGKIISVGIITILNDCVSFGKTNKINNEKEKKK
ncbi:MAG: hypothetical protein EHM12_11335 [Dehalococcoidia bacterium]|nr:MAG: hypothetical protein EHM12_11335 [Dehalococcoidia bacterium]